MNPIEKIKQLSEQFIEVDRKIASHFAGCTSKDNDIGNCECQTYGQVENTLDRTGPNKAIKIITTCKGPKIYN